MKKKNKIGIFSVIVIFSPLTIIARELGFREFVDNIYQQFVNNIVTLIFSLAIVFFAWNVLKFVLSEDEDKSKYKSSMLWGIIALFVMFSVWGLLSIINDTFFNSEIGKYKNYDFESDYEKFKPSAGEIN